MASLLILTNISLLPVFFVLILFGCSKSSEKRIDYYTNGSVKSEATISNGRKNGNYKEYYEDGTLKLNADVEEDTLNGKSYKYYPNGKLAEDFQFIKGRLFGVNMFYGRNGKLKEMREYDSSGRMIAANL